MHAQSYIKAAYALLRDGEPFEKVSTRLHEVLSAHGHQALYAKIIRGLLAEFTKRASHDAVVVSVAREKDIEKNRSAIETALTHHNLESTYTTNIDPTLIGGFTIQQKDTRIDQSHKRQLLEIYRALIG